MADIDKGLPNIKTVLPGGAEEVTDVNIAEIQKQGPIEVTSEDDGGATIDFDPRENLKIPGTESHFDNLADILPDDVTDPIGSELRFQYQDNKTSRKEWEQTYTQGLDLLGFSEENAGGGIAGIRRPNAIPPVSGPVPQGGGLSSQFNRVKKLME